jgi:hypothetical protein
VGPSLLCRGRDAEGGGPQQRVPKREPARLADEDPSLDRLVECSVNVDVCGSKRSRDGRGRRRSVERAQQYCPPRGRGKPGQQVLVVGLEPLADGEPIR